MCPVEGNTYFFSSNYITSNTGFSILNDNFFQFPLYKPMTYIHIYFSS